MSIVSTITRRFGLDPLNDRVTQTDDVSVAIDPERIDDPRPPIELPATKMVRRPTWKTDKTFGGQTELSRFAGGIRAPEHLDRRADHDAIMNDLFDRGVKLGAILEDIVVGWWHHGPMPPDDTETGTPVFSPEGVAAREELRVALHESAVAMQRDRLALVKGEIDTSSYELSDRIRELGFAGEAERVFDLLPLVHVAWADGTIQPGEREAILRLLTVRGFGPGEAFTTMEALLEKQPSREYMEESLEVLRELLQDKPREARTVVGLCIMVAEAAGGLFQLFNPVSKEEREAIERIAKALGDDAFAEYRDRLGNKKK